MPQPLMYLTRNGRTGPFHVEGACLRCGKRLDPSTAVWLELDQRTGEYHDFGGVPTESSQGGFAFGPECASALRKRARAATEHLTA